MPWDHEQHRRERVSALAQWGVFMPVFFTVLGSDLPATVQVAVFAVELTCVLLFSVLARRYLAERPAPGFDDPRSWWYRGYSSCWVVIPLAATSTLVAGSLSEPVLADDGFASALLMGNIYALAAAFALRLLEPRGNDARSETA